MWFVILPFITSNRRWLGMVNPTSIWYDKIYADSIWWSWFYYSIDGTVHNRVHTDRKRILSLQFVRWILRDVTRWFAILGPVIICLVEKTNDGSTYWVLIMTSNERYIRLLEKWHRKCIKTTVIWLQFSPSNRPRFDCNFPCQTDASITFKTHSIRRQSDS